MRIIGRIKLLRSNIIVGVNILELVGMLIGEIGPVENVFIISDSNAAKHGRIVLDSCKTYGFCASIHYLNAGEGTKTLDAFCKLLNFLFDNGASKESVIIAVGGGTVTDLVGFASSVIFRGIRLINVPTTLLGQVDASIGGKNAVNYDLIKNAVGTVYHPYYIINDVSTLFTLSKGEFSNGMAESIKHSIISSDPELFNFLKCERDKIMDLMDVKTIADLVLLNCKIKSFVVSCDQNGCSGKRIFLHFGHIFAHAIESETLFRIPHGSSVSFGILLSLLLSTKKSDLPYQRVTEVAELLRSYSLPTDPSTVIADLDTDRMIDRIFRRKTSSGGILEIPLLKEINMPVLYKNINRQNVEDAARELLEQKTVTNT